MEADILILRHQLNVDGVELLICVRDRVVLDLEQVLVDARASMLEPTGSDVGLRLGEREFLEGLDIPEFGLKGYPEDAPVTMEA